MPAGVDDDEVGAALRAAAYPVGRPNPGPYAAALLEGAETGVAGLLEAASASPAGPAEGTGLLGTACKAAAGEARGTKLPGAALEVLADLVATGP